MKLCLKKMIFPDEDWIKDMEKPVKVSGRNWIKCFCSSDSHSASR